MNERIQELYNKAWLQVDPRNPQETFTQAFAELMIKDCVQMFAENGYDESCDMLIEHWDMDPRIFRS